MHTYIHTHTHTHIQQKLFASVKPFSRPFGTNVPDIADDEFLDREEDHDPAGVYVCVFLCLCICISIRLSVC